MTPFFSIVIPAYNRANTLGAALTSVLQQEFLNLEIIIVDDGSNDHPEDVVASIGDPRVTIIRQENAGGGAARNRGIEAARGKYIAFLDSDDQFLPGKLSKAARVLDGDDRRVYYSKMKVDRGVQRFWIRPDRGIAPNEDVGEYLFCANQLMQTSTLIVPNRLARSVLFDPELKRGQDLDFCVRLQSHGALFAMMDEPLVIWCDASEAGRTSYVKGYELSSFWLDRCGHLLTRKARHGYRATVLAYHVAPIKPALAAKYLVSGWILGGVSTNVILRQILRSYLPRNRYRALVNVFVKLFGGRAPSAAKNN